jgi:hypothetical protein
MLDTVRNRVFGKSCSTPNEFKVVLEILIGEFFKYLPEHLLEIIVKGV